MSHRRALGLLVTVAVATALTAAAPVRFPWKATFTEASSPDLARLDEAIHASHEDSLRACPVKGLVWTEEDFKLTMESGTLFLEPPIDGRTAGAFFEGKATFSFTPPQRGARGALRTHLGHDTLEDVPVGSAYIFTLRPDSPLSTLAVPESCAQGSAPRRLDTYISDKSASRQLGLELTLAFLNKDGPGKDTAFILLPLAEIRGRFSPEARLLYRMSPLTGASVGLGVFGSDELIALKPYKYRFVMLLSYAPHRTPVGLADILGVQVQVTPGAGSKPAHELATITFATPPGVAGLRFVLDPRMEISSIRDDAGNAVPFLQWGHLKTFPDFDPAVLVALGAPPPRGAPQNRKLLIESSGLLFETVAHMFYLVDESAWFPRFPATDESPHELILTIPKNLAGVGVGRKISDTVDGLMRTLVFRTTKPTVSSTFYYGDYTVTEGEAAGIKVELYLDRLDISEQHNARAALGEITGALEFMTEILCPLEIDVLRAVSTPSRRVTGFEGLILLGPTASHTSYKAAADLARAAAVAHQWFGNYVKIKNWPRDRWLFSGLAHYLAMEYYRTKPLVSMDAHEAIRRMWNEPLTFGSMQRKNLAGKKEELEGGTAYPLLAATDNVYTKGPMVFQMLRYLMDTKTGDEDAFFEMLRDFTSTYQYLPAGTEEFQRIAEKHMGESLDWFFRQWVADGGIPVLTWRHEIAPDGGGWKVTLRATQEQRSYRLLAPVVLHYADGTTETKPWLIEGPESTGVVSAGKKPLSVTLNDNLELLAVVKAR